MSPLIVVAEDDAKQAELIRRYLERENHTVMVSVDGLAAIETVRQLRPALLILDVMLPTVDGLDVARVLRAESSVPILMLTARSTEDDLLLGLDVGADDYMTKPFSPRELMARVRSLLRRTAGLLSSDGGDVLTVGAVTVDTLRHRVEIDGQQIDLTPGEFQLLEVLAREPDRVFTRDQLLEHLHGFARFITYRSIDVHVMNLRKKIERDPRRPVHLLTVFGVGYKLTDSTPATSNAP